MAKSSLTSKSQKNGQVGKPRFGKAYGFALVTAVLFLLSWTGQFVAQAITVMNEARDHGQQFMWSDFFAQFFASTFENWQSEFLQLIWQAIGLSILFLWGSSQSRESDERIEAKLDVLLEKQGVDPLQISKDVNSAM